jgi:hypothetical protein
VIDSIWEQKRNVWTEGKLGDKRNKVEKDEKEKVNGSGY